MRKLENKSQQATAAGGSAINMSLFIKNSVQLNKMLNLEMCSSAEDKTKVGLDCDAWNEQTRRYKLSVVAVVLSLVLGLVYGICTITENQILKRMNAEERDDDDEDVIDTKIQKTIRLRTTTACVGFTLSLLNIGLETFVDQISPWTANMKPGNR